MADEGNKNGVVGVSDVKVNGVDGAQEAPTSKAKSSPVASMPVPSSHARIGSKPTLISRGGLKFLIMDAPRTANLHLYLKEMKKVRAKGRRREGWKERRTCWSEGCKDVLERRMEGAKRQQYIYISPKVIIISFNRHFSLRSACHTLLAHTAHHYN